MSVCACVGPQGDCPCIRAQRGEQPEITETFISPDVFALLDKADKLMINSLKRKAMFLFLDKNLKHDESN